jgi:drug/metabolite transporter (DMT)-like permease
LLAYRDANDFAKQDQPKAITLLSAGIGRAVVNAIFLVVWPHSPFRWITPRSMILSALTGLLFNFGMLMYIYSCEQGVPACIAGPISGLYVVFPPIWYVLRDRVCVSLKTGAGFILSLVSVVLFSGLICDSGSFQVSLSDWMVLLGSVLGGGIGTITQCEASTDVSFKQFPQGFMCLTIGYLTGCVIFSCALNASDITKRSNWVPFGIDHILAIFAAVCTSVGVGSFSLCLFYANNVNIMVALSSLNIVIPAILGILVLSERATWNIILGIVLALAGMIILSLESKDDEAISGSIIGRKSFFLISSKRKRNYINRRSLQSVSSKHQSIDISRKSLQSLSMKHQEKDKLNSLDKTPLLFEPCL